jgi:hypothetical protein
MRRKGGHDKEAAFPQIKVVKDSNVLPVKPGQPICLLVEDKG